MSLSLGTLADDMSMGTSKKSHHEGQVINIISERAEIVNACLTQHFTP